MGGRCPYRRQRALLSGLCQGQGGTFGAMACPGIDTVTLGTGQVLIVSKQNLCYTIK